MSEQNQLPQRRPFADYNEQEDGKIVRGADFTSAKILRKKSETTTLKASRPPVKAPVNRRQVWHLLFHPSISMLLIKKKSIAPFAPQAGFVNFLVYMEPGSSNDQRPRSPSPEDPWQSEDPAHESTVAAAYIRTGDPLDGDPTDFDDHEIRMSFEY